MTEMKKTMMEELAGAMGNAAVEELTSETKRMTDDELDMVAGGYRYGMITRNIIKGNVVYKMHNLNTGKVETFSGKTERAAIIQLVKHNFMKRERWIILTDPKGKVCAKMDVNVLAKEIGLKR